ncbi:MAG: hypothetical protein K8R87_07580 [Verrucomicrobia bacterium]|nr:hypothetical protein [Verrucomicrobiota bacterium]
MIALIENALPLILAEEEIKNFPLHYQIGCIVLTGLFVLSFSITRDPRSWRRLYQTRIAKRDDFSVNKNKTIDEFIKKWGILVAMFFLVLNVTIFIIGITKTTRLKSHTMTADEKFQALEYRKVIPASAANQDH